MIVLVGITAFLFSLSESRLVFWFVLFAWSGIGCAFCPVVILSLFWKGTTRAGAIAGMCSGFIITMLWAVFLKSSTNLYEMVPGFIGSILTILLVSLLTKPPEKAAREIQEVKETIANYNISM